MQISQFAVDSGVVVTPVVEAVAATATYEDVISGEKYTVTAYGLYGDTMIITPGTTYKADYAKDERVALQIGKRSGYTLKDLTLVGISESDLTWTAKMKKSTTEALALLCLTTA